VKVPGRPGYIVPGNLPQPEWNMNSGIQYAAKTPLGSITPRFDWTYLSKQTFNPASSIRPPTPEYTLPARSVYNGQLTYQPEDGRWTATFSVQNLFNKYYFYNQFTGSTVALAGVLAPPREFLLTLKRDFR
jgi:iron complex outermembrane receptor protein